MVHVGYRPAFAAAVEAVASTGGQILPPVMGAIAFVMAEWIEVPYSTIVVAALVPALLYFLIVFVSVDLQARKDGIQALARADIPPLLAVLRSGWIYLVPIAVLIWMLMVKGLPPGMSAMYASVALVGTSYIFRDRSRWLTPRKIVIALGNGVKHWLGVVVITGSVGIMIGALELSGVGIKFSGFIVDLADGNLYLALVLVGVASLIVGMGLDAIPAYMTLATLMAPALVEMGVPTIAAHLFVVYWGLASFYTPPMCIVVYVTTAISGSKIWETGWEAVKLGIAAFLIPYAFAINQGLLLDGSPAKILLATSTAAVGSILVACAVRGYLFGHISAIPRILVFSAGLLFIAPGVKLPLTGLAIIGVVIATAKLLGGRTQ
jgi:TRAP transporter 4TM/12TM fusion protein